MKTANDPRHIRRQHMVQELFKVDFHDQPTIDEVKKIFEHKQFLDDVIRKAAPEFPLDKINKTDLAILRLGTYELLIEKNAPAHVIVDEAIELAKEFSGDSSPAFVNGALGKIISHETTT